MIGTWIRPRRAWRFVRIALVYPNFPKNRPDLHNLALFFCQKITRGPSAGMVTQLKPAALVYKYWLTFPFSSGWSSFPSSFPSISRWSQNYNMYVTKSKMILRHILTMILPDLYIFSGISWLEGKGRESTGTMAAATRMNVVAGKV